MLFTRARDNHPLHDQFYEGGFPQVFQTGRGPVERAIPLFAVAKYQFEPILENELKPLTNAECDIRNHIKKHSGKILIQCQS